MDRQTGELNLIELNFGGYNKQKAGKRDEYLAPRKRYTGGWRVEKRIGLALSQKGIMKIGG